LVARHCQTARHTNQLAQMAFRKTCERSSSTGRRGP
jgi:hypothetical protein